MLALAAVLTDAIVRRPPVYTLDLQPRRADRRRPRRRVRVRPRARQRGDARARRRSGSPPERVYFAVNTILLAFAIAVEEGAPRWIVWRQNYAWLLPHYLAYGLVGAVVAIAYEQVHIYALAVFLVPLVLMRATQVGQLRAVTRERGSAAGRGEHDPPAERLARGRKPAAAHPVHRGTRGPVGDRRRPGCLHGRALAARA